MIRFLPVFLLLAVLTGCTSPKEFSYELSETDSGATLRPEPGDTIRIVLKSNPTTGYLWKEDGVPDSDVLRKVSDEIRSENKTLVGAPGVQTMVYKVVGSGETGIRLSYRRPWEKSVPQDTFQVRIIVDAPVGFIELLDNSKIPTRRVGSKGQVEPLFEE